MRLEIRTDCVGLEVSHQLLAKNDGDDGRRPTGRAASCCGDTELLALDDVTPGNREAPVGAPIRPLVLAELVPVRR